MAVEQAVAEDLRQRLARVQAVMAWRGLGGLLLYASGRRDAIIGGQRPGCCQRGGLLASRHAGGRAAP